MQGERICLSCWVFAPEILLLCKIWIAFTALTFFLKSYSSISFCFGFFYRFGRSRSLFGGKSFFFSLSLSLYGDSSACLQFSISPPERLNQDFLSSWLAIFFFFVFFCQFSTASAVGQIFSLRFFSIPSCLRLLFFFYCLPFPCQSSPKWTALKRVCVCLPFWTPWTQWTLPHWTVESINAFSTELNWTVKFVLYKISLYTVNTKGT